LLIFASAATIAPVITINVAGTVGNNPDTFSFVLTSG
jgi:hypothetical protein